MAMRTVGVKLLLCLWVAGLSAAAPLGAQDKSAPSIAGVWQGTLDFGVTKLRLVFDLKKKDGGFTGTMDSPDQGALDLPIDEVSVEEKTVKFTLKKLGGSYEGQLSDNGKQIDGKW